MKARAIGAVGVSVLLLAGTTALSSMHAAGDNTEIAWQCQGDEYLIDFFSVGGRPLNNDQEHRVKVLINHGFVVGYCEERRCPLWAAYKASDLVSGTDPERFDRPSFFPPDQRATPAVDGRTFGGGFDRGHMVPNAVIGTQYGTLSQMETFLMTNMCAQRAELNQQAWADLEAWIPEEAEDREHLYVIIGPIFGDDPAVVANGAERGIQIPDAFYCIIADTSFEFNTNPSVALIAYIFPQDTAANADFKDRTLFAASVTEIQQLTGLDFFPKFDAAISNWDDKEGAIEMTHW